MLIKNKPQFASLMTSGLWSFDSDIEPPVEQYILFDVTDLEDFKINADCTNLEIKMKEGEKGYKFRNELTLNNHKISFSFTRNRQADFNLVDKLVRASMVGILIRNNTIHVFGDRKGLELKTIDCKSDCESSYMTLEYSQLPKKILIEDIGMFIQKSINPIL